MKPRRCQPQRGQRKALVLAIKRKQGMHHSRGNGWWRRRQGNAERCKQAIQREGQPLAIRKKSPQGLPVIVPHEDAACCGKQRAKAFGEQKARRRLDKVRPTFGGRIKHKPVVLVDGRAQRPYQCDEELGRVAIRSTAQQIVWCEGQKPGQQIVLPIRGDRDVRRVKGGQLTAQRAGQLDALIRLLEGVPCDAGCAARRRRAAGARSNTG